MDPTATEDYVSMAKLARDKGMKVGIITTVSLDHATPASFYACAPSLSLYYDIALQVPESRFNFWAAADSFSPGAPIKIKRTLSRY
ncbi:MAG: alkaline phosphatase [Treponema sp.]|jgi:alkaline phosphatase|nr:alkaline phosphatase [Treponema sp.]